MRFEYDEFKIIENGFEKKDFRLSESIMSIGNEYMGMRGNFEEKYSGDSHKGIYLGGIWFPDKTRVGWWKNGYPEYFGKMINSPNFIGLDVKIDGEYIDLYKDEVVSFVRELDMKNGVLNRYFTIRKNNKNFEMRVQRFVSIDTKEICAINYEVKAIDSKAFIEFFPYIDADIVNEDSNYEEKFWEVLDKNADENNGYILSKTIPNEFGIDRFSVCNYMISNFEGKLNKSKICNKYVECSFSKNIEKGEVAKIEKIVAVTTSRDYEENELVEVARDIAQKNAYYGYEKLYDNHSRKWRERWDKADVIIKNNPKLQQGIRYNIFQLFSTYYGEDLRLNIGPKGFTGEKYGGATYWDTEAYIIPMYLSVAPQEVTKNLLLYRYNQLEEAYHNAKQQGLKGALYPMVTFTGVECHNEWEITFEEIHRNGAIAYAIYNYVNYTGDYDYITDYGIDVLVGISRFWADRVHYNNRKKCYMIHGVTGPNEYENNVNNNWYTNLIAVWTLEYTISIIRKISDYKMAEKLKRLEISLDEINKWQGIIDNIYLPYDDELGILFNMILF